MGHVIRVGVMCCIRNVGVNLSVIQIGVKNEVVRENLTFLIEMHSGSEILMVTERKGTNKGERSKR